MVLYEALKGEQKVAKEVKREGFLFLRYCNFHNYLKFRKKSEFSNVF